MWRGAECGQEGEALASPTGGFTAAIEIQSLPSGLHLWSQTQDCYASSYCKSNVQPRQSLHDRAACFYFFFSNFMKCIKKIYKKVHNFFFLLLQTHISI